MIIDDESQERASKKVSEVIDVIGDESYFEQVLILEMVRDSLRTMWLADVSKEAQEKGEY